jgi:hypothetical protein
MQCSVDRVLPGRTSQTTLQTFALAYVIVLISLMKGQGTQHSQKDVIKTQMKPPLIPHPVLAHGINHVSSVVTGCPNSEAWDKCGKFCLKR